MQIQWSFKKICWNFFSLFLKQPKPRFQSFLAIVIAKLTTILTLTSLVTFLRRLCFPLKCKNSAKTNVSNMLLSITSKVKRFLNFSSPLCMPLLGRAQFKKLTVMIFSKTYIQISAIQASYIICGLKAIFFRMRSHKNNNKIKFLVKLALTFCPS